MYIGDKEFPKHLLLWLIALSISVCLLPITSQSQDQATPRPLTPDEAAKVEIIKSEKWRRAQAAFQQWLAVEKVYSDAEVEQLKKGLVEQIKSMNSIELRDVLDRMEAKLAILLSPQADEARKWIGNYMSVLATHRKEELRKSLPDVAKMSTAELEEYLRKFQGRRAVSAERAKLEIETRQRQVRLALQANNDRMEQFNRARQSQNAAIARRTSQKVQQANAASLRNARRPVWRPPVRRPVVGIRW